jgi:hypothetical protein
MSASPSLADRAWQEVVQLHDFFFSWLRGEAPAGDFSRAETAIGGDFRMISPDGTIEESAAVLAWIRGAHGSRPAPFTIAVLDPRTIWTGEGAVLLEYTEQQYRDGRTTRRRSTALFLANPAAPCGVEWRHLQETWMEAG